MRISLNKEKHNNALTPENFKEPIIFRKENQKLFDYELLLKVRQALHKVHNVKSKSDYLDLEFLNYVAYDLLKKTCDQTLLFNYHKNYYKDVLNSLAFSIINDNKAQELYWNSFVDLICTRFRIWKIYKQNEKR